MRALALLAGVLATSGPPRAAGEAAAPAPPRLATEIAAFAEELARQGEFSGVVLIAQGQTTLLARAWGLADRVGRVNALDTPFNLASTTKCLTAVAVAQLVEEGRLAYADRLGDRWPDYPDPAVRAVTVEQLATHTAGLGEVVKSQEFRRAPQRFARLADYVALVEAQGQVGAAGTYFYGDADYVLLGALVERVSGMPFTRYMAEKVFLASGMKQTGYLLRPPPTGLAHGYTKRDVGDAGFPGAHGMRWQDNASILPTLASPGAAAWSTAWDLLGFGRALLAGRLLGTAALAELFRGRVDTGQDGVNAQYTRGFFTGKAGQARVVAHGGTGPGIDVGFDLYPDTDTIVIVLANQDPPAAQLIRDRVRQGLGKTGGADTPSSR